MFAGDVTACNSSKYKLPIQWMIILYFLFSFFVLIIILSQQKTLLKADASKKSLLN